MRLGKIYLTLFRLVRFIRLVWLVGLVKLVRFDFDSLVRLMKQNKSRIFFEFVLVEIKMSRA